MKGYLVRITPLIFDRVRRRFCVTQLCSPVSRPGCVRIRASPWVVEAQGVAPVPHWLYGRGLTWRFRQQKRHLAFAPRCLTCYTERIQLEL